MLDNTINSPSISGPAAFTVRSGAQANVATAEQQQGEGFERSMIGALQGLSRSLATAERVAVEGIEGRASALDVAQGVIGAEQSLHATLAIRDKIVAAYLELSRMAI